MSKENQVISIVAEILELDVSDLNLETELNSANWDSLAIITFISEVDSEFDKVLSPDQVGAASKIVDLVKLV